MEPAFFHVTLGLVDMLESKEVGYSERYYGKHRE